MYNLGITPVSVIWAWRPGIVGAAAAPIQTWSAAFCFLKHAVHAWLPFYGGPCGDTREGVPVPTTGPPTLHGPPPLFGGSGDGLTTCFVGACHG